MVKVEWCHNKLKSSYIWDTLVRAGKNKILAIPQQEIWQNYYLQLHGKEIIADVMRLVRKQNVGVLPLGRDGERGYEFTQAKDGYKQWPKVGLLQKLFSSKLK